jgi:PAS domain S-box-containing protein
VSVYPVGFFAIVGYVGLLFGSVYRDHLLNPSPESLSREVLATIADSIIVLDSDGYVRMVNPKAEELLGYPEEALLQKHFAKFLDPGDVEAARRFVSHFRHSDRAMESGVFSLRDRDGNLIPTACNLSAIRGWTGKAVGFVFALRDLKEIVRSREIIQEQEGEIRDAHERYSALFNRSLFGVYLHDFEGNFLDANQSALDLLGYSREEIGSLNFASLLGQEDLSTALAYMEETIKRGRREDLISFRLRRKDGTFVWVETESSVIYRSGEPYAIQGIARDITERKKAEEELRRHNEELRELDKMKDSFLSSVSHELRTPLTSIRSFSEILLRYDQEDLATQKEFIGIINSESERLTRLINDVLDLSRIEAGGMVWNDQLLEFDMVIHSIVPAHQRALDAKSIRLHLDLPAGLPFVLADPDRMRQVLSNLLINAIKFSHEGSEIRVALGAFEESRSEEPRTWIKVSVADKGIGIEEKDFDAIFDKFRQVTTDTMKSKPQGTGLGLHICRDIVLHYEGKIWVESEKGKGSTFFFTLPAAEVDSVPAKEDSPSGQPSDPDRTLLTKGPFPP